MKKFDRFMRSKTGKIAAGVFVLLMIAIVVIGGLNGLFLSGTAGIPLSVPTYPTYEMPKDGYTCLPTCIENDTKMFILAGSNQASMSNTPIKIWIMVPGDQPTFTLGIFDGDSGKDINNTLTYRSSGDINGANGNWDDSILSPVDTTYTLYADPIADGSGQVALASWLGNEFMPNNAWWETTVKRDEQAKAPNGHYYYRLEATRPVEATGGQAFKVRASGYIMTGQRPEWAVGLTGMLATVNDIKIIYPQSNGNPNKLGSQTTYNGDWQMYFKIPSNVKEIVIWDGDFDRGAGIVLDTDDPNTEGKPNWATTAAVDERAGGVGQPNDDNRSAYLRVSPSATYEILDPLGMPIYINNDPSGTEEWEKYIVSVNPSDNPEFLSTKTLDAGLYNIHIKGLDLHNYIWIGINYPICDLKGCPPSPWVDADYGPGPTTYWKGSFKRYGVEGAGGGGGSTPPSSNAATGCTGIGKNETTATMDFGLRNVALASALFRNGINVDNPVAIDTATPMTGAEANDILQKGKGSNTKLARTLQQDLTAWLNLATGKIAANAQIELTGISGGDFSGTMLEALRYADDIILDPAKRADSAQLQRAQDIADMINNNSLNDLKKEDKAYDGSCYTPKGKQPPKHDKMPKADKPNPPDVTPEPPTPPEPPVCRAPENNYGQGYAIIALNPADCQGEQNGLLFHGTSTTTVSTAFSNGCLRSVGTNAVKGLVDYVGPFFGDMSLIDPEATQVTDPLPESAWMIAAPNCSDPAAIQMDGKDFKGDLLLQPGLYCISGDATINAQDTLVGSGVTLYFADGKLTINGGSTVILSAPTGDAATVSPALPGVLIYLPQENSNVVEIDGNSESWYQGTVYAPASEIHVLGTGQVHGGWAQFIGWDVRVGGTADVFIDYLDRSLPVCTP